jgi:hypothetical protein
LTNEYQSDPSRIHYIYNMGDRKIDAGTYENQRTMRYEDMLKAVFTPAGAVFQPESRTSQAPVMRWTPQGFVSK